MKFHLSILTVVFIGISSVAAETNRLLSVLETKQHIGEVVTVKGKVCEVKTSGKENIFLNIDGKYPHEPFCVFIEAASLGAFPGGINDLNKLDQKVIYVTGKIQNYKLKPEIVVTSPEQISLTPPDSNNSSKK
jgi:DNA/RNA endonuclease YhcR with UshA esterase domain